MLKNLLKGIAAVALIVSFAACNTSFPAPITQKAVAYNTLTSVFDVTGKTAGTVSYIYDEDTSAEEIVACYDMDLFLTKTNVNALVNASETVVDYRSMFSYDVIASDGYSFLTRNSTLCLTDMLSGKYLYDTAGTDGNFTAGGEDKSPRVYFPALDIVKGYDIKDAKDIKLYRAVKISVTGRTDSSTVLTDSITAADLSWVKIKNDTEYENTNKSVAVENLLYDFFVANEDGYQDRRDATYLVKCADYDAADEMTFESLTYKQLQAGYFIPSSKTITDDGEYEDLLVVMTGTAADGTSPSNDDSSLRLKNPVEITVTW
jgi:hypothetical protein